MPPLTTRHRRAVLAVVCLSVFAIQLDTTIVNVALPDLVRQLHATTRDLQWIVDGYNLAFAALVLTGGSLGDRLGRRPALLTGLAGFALSSGAAALVHSPSALVGLRFVMGTFAALVYPTTLSIITNAFTDRRERAAAIGVWGAVTGLGVAVGPVTGGLLLAHFWWGSIFVALTPLALVAAVLTALVVPESRDAAGARLDPPGLLASTAAIGTLVYTIIEAPQRGWLDPLSIAGYVATTVFALVFAAIERRRDHPMIDLSLFRNPAFSAASGAVTVSFFALFGFIFLITQYMQFIRGWGSLSTGVRILPVAASIAVGSVVGAAIVGRIGTRAVVVSGLLLFGASLAWIATAATMQSYVVIAAQMVLMGTGLGLTSAPATESILSVLPPAKAGLGSAVNDATREAGGTLGVAVIGSVATSVYLHHLAHSAVDRLPAPLATLSRQSVGAGMTVAHRVPSAASRLLTHDLTNAFMSGLHIACLVGAGVCVAGAVLSLALPGRARTREAHARAAAAGSASSPDDSGALAA